MIAALDRHVEERSSFCLETTLAGVTYAKRIPTWRQRGYSVTLIFIALASAELAVARVAERVRHGGHSIPEATIRRRFELGRRNFERVYSRLVDQWILYDNSDTQMRVISWGVQA
jgi:predicted ABC-type ATPase